MEKHTHPFLTKVSQIPVVQLAMDEESLACKLVTDSGCRVYGDRPWACRLYPLDTGDKQGSEKSAPRPLYSFADLTRMRLMMLLGLDLASRRSPEQAIMVARKNLDRLEELALVLFWQAVSECYPDHPLLEKKPWANAWRIHLKPEKWEEDGVFSPDTAPRSLKSMRDNFTGIFTPQGLREWLLYELPYKMLHWGNGFVYYKIVPKIRELVFVNKPSMWARRWLVKDYPSQPGNV